MDIFQVVILALIQGITEFLPISSSAHLILPKELLGWPDQGLAFDVAVHVGTLAAVLIYFRQDILRLTMGWINSAALKGTDEHGRLAWYIILATVPAGIAGLLFDDFIEMHFRSMLVIAFTTIFYGLVLWYADKFCVGKHQLVNMTIVAALIIGFAQALALVPGTSRSGITITAALLLGFSRTESARFSFLLSIPIILLGGGYKGLSLIDEPNVDWMAILIGTFVSGFSAYLCIHFFLKAINKMSMLPFVVYRLCLGILLLGIAWF